MRSVGLESSGRLDWRFPAVADADSVSRASSVPRRSVAGRQQKVGLTPSATRAAAPLVGALRAGILIP
jgi:hypothetical protein